MPRSARNAAPGPSCLAIVTLRSPGTLSAAERRDVAAYLRARAEDIEQLAPALPTDSDVRWRCYRKTLRAR